MENINNESLLFLRHTFAVLAYRGGKAIKGVPEDFRNYKISPEAKPPIAILAHVNDLLDWTLHLIKGKSVWKNSKPRSWAFETERFHKKLEKIDSALSSGKEIKCSYERIFQGPVADALTHIGQIAYLRRIAGIGVMGENYFVADISAGRVGVDQAKPKIEFE